jgi:hypothetical protein
VDYLRSLTTTTTGSHSPATRGGGGGEKKGQDSCLVYSVGSNNRIDFEIAVKKFLPACETHTFDPSLDEPFVGDAYATFHPWGIGEDNGKFTVRGTTFDNTKSLMSIYEELGHVGRRLDILKIDCEGCESVAMVPLFEAIIQKKIQVDQILIEMHNKPEYGATDEIRWERFKEFFAAADRAKMRIFHKERNQWGCNGMSCVEYALVSEEFLRRANAHNMCGNDNTPLSAKQ